MRTRRATSVFVACTAAFLAACSPVRGGEEPSFSALSYKNLIPNESYSPAAAPLALTPLYTVHPHVAFVVPALLLAVAAPLLVLRGTVR